ncbi:MAG: DGQHR domain-containing protein [Alphaproteobacteria bacterium]|nr:DGQHR domain-containing protein [Alphaproteobacteria bacterium]
MNKKKKKNISLTKDQLQKRQKSALKRKIRSVFEGAGFEYIPTNNKQMHIGRRDIEIDSLFIFENVWLVCEDTVTTQSSGDHVRTKNEAVGEIKDNLTEFITKLTELFPDKKDIITNYNESRIKLFGLYIPLYDPAFDHAEYELYNNLIFILPQTLEYFKWVVSCIKHSARNEIFRFLDIKSNQIGSVRSASDYNNITAPIIYPKEFTGITEKVRIVSFMMSAEDLLNTCYVLRKDNWEDSIWLYQRLIKKGKIKKIRDFLEEKGSAFYNNIIVALPDNVAFLDESGHHIDIEKINDLENNCKLVLPKEMNSICVIDGQHRIFAHYDSGLDTKQEKRISELRKQLHLLVTGLVFDKNVTKEERAKIQSEIFHDINSNATSVPRAVLTQIKRIQNPIDDESIAQSVVECLNREGIFKNLLQISSLDAGKIKTASIVRFALRYLVTVTPAEGKKSLFDFWDGDKESLLSVNDTALQNYVKFCVSVLREYFGAICKNYNNYWTDPNSKLLSVICLNGFIIALTRQLDVNGVKDFNYYDGIFSKWSFDFSSENFPYTSSQYRKFSTKILKDAFEIDESILDII